MTRQNHLLESEELMAYLDGELRPDRAAEAAAHLADCRECQKLAAELQEISRVMMAWEVEPCRGIDDDSILTAFEPQRKARFSWATSLQLRGWQRWGWKAAGACVITLLVLGIAIPNLLRSRMATYAPAAAVHQKQEPQQMLVPPTAGVVDDITRSSGRSLTGYSSQNGTGSAGKLLKEAEPSGSASIAGPMIVRTANLVLISEQFPGVRTRLDEIVSRHGGYIAQLTANSPVDNGRSLTGTIRVPAAQLDATLAALKDLGRLEMETQNGQEITAQYIDLQARLTNAFNTEQRLTDILRNRTGRLSDVLAVEQEIDRVRGEIEEMEAQKKSLRDQVDLASVGFSIKEDYKGQLKMVPFSTGMRYRYALIAGYRAMMDSLIEVSLWLLAWVPSLLVWGAVLFFPARVAWRKLRTRSVQ